MHLNWPPFIMGVLALIAGVLIVRYRVRLAARIVKSNRAMFGALGRRFTVKQSPRAYGVAGICFMIFGAVLVVLLLVSSFFH